ncbi:MAG: HNH endonuclease [Crocinitomicaceae bacterium]|nr:HNH endonuclease [Crocinitomicaceae bacterium]MDG1776878.1 HNH endonuclease [Crocinitomicaceae bacterium]
MANKWGIPIDVENFVLQRDKTCVYCDVEFDNTIRKFKQSWEHIVNDIRINGSDNIALCCVSCNASKGAKDLEVWLTTEYCKKKNITPKNVAEVVRAALIKKPALRTT